MKAERAEAAAASFAALNTAYETYVREVYGWPGGPFALLEAMEGCLGAFEGSNDTRDEFERRFLIDVQDCWPVSGILAVMDRDSAQTREWQKSSWRCTSFAWLIYAAGGASVLSRCAVGVGTAFTPGSVAARTIKDFWRPDEGDAWRAMASWFFTWMPRDDVLDCIYKRVLTRFRVTLQDTAFVVQHAICDAAGNGNLWLLTSKAWPQEAPEPADTALLRTALRHFLVPDRSAGGKIREPWVREALKLIVARNWVDGLPLLLPYLAHVTTMDLKCAMSYTADSVCSDYVGTGAFEGVWMPLLEAVGYKWNVFAGLRGTPSLSVSTCHRLLSWLPEVAAAGRDIAANGMLLGAIARTRDVALLEEARSTGVRMRFAMRADAAGWVGDLCWLVNAGYNLAGIVAHPPSYSMATKSIRGSRLAAMRAVLRAVENEWSSDELCRREVPLETCPVCAVARLMITSQGLPAGDLARIFANQRDLFRQHTALDVYRLRVVNVAQLRAEAQAEAIKGMMTQAAWRGPPISDFFNGGHVL